ncbi:tRNA epoxyqueuosine(34) reductase QueG [Taibaiella lutea]|uniref:Epoxyqueuosine reductase n=1 Tax=Taibaiella lutea TaxID=2608001 RepID=A0A5M6CB79_9BACT|nr:tRNA epoxyqueuosine(34) reductase QueG [Taibaiella lutea]KAA5532271.1 tRNA epoxyqueuosine(34) reductase QueG [Taibaiella lutea]
MASTIQSNTTFVKKISAQLGFDYCGIARAQRLDEDARRLETWLSKGFHGKMGYMERNFDLRVDPAKLVPGAKSVITLLLNYYPEEKQNPEAPKIAKYAFGMDYHDVIRAKMNEFLFELRNEIGDIDGRGFVDSAPVLERSWAVKSGLGWVGKNGNLINKQNGSFFFIATLITDLELVADDPFARDFCGSCTRCIEACPTDAIGSNAVIDGSKCISYLTIELKDELIAPEFKDKMEGWMFGCDICQDVCPWNRFSKPNHTEAFLPIPELLNLNTAEWEEMDESTFKTLLRNSPIKRSKWKGIQRNLKFLPAKL